MGVRIPPGVLNLSNMANLKKGNIIVFSRKDKPNETIIKGSSDPINGMVTTDKQEYSVDFLNRWVHFGFCRVFKPADLPSEYVGK
jgi:hypothetical protein